MKLWYASASPFVRKVLAAAHEIGLADRLEPVPAGTSPVNPNKELVADNPAGKIPALVSENGDVLFDSSVICAYLDSLHEGHKLIPQEGPERFRVLTLESLGDAIMDAAILARYEITLRPEDKQWADWIEGQMAKVRNSLDRLEAEWLEFLQGPLTIGHLSIAAALGYLDFRFTDEHWRTSRPGLARWFEGFAQRPSMQASAPKP